VLLLLPFLALLPLLLLTANKIKVSLLAVIRGMLALREVVRMQDEENEVAAVVIMRATVEVELLEEEIIVVMAPRTIVTREVHLVAILMKR